MRIWVYETKTVSSFFRVPSVYECATLARTPMGHVARQLLHSSDRPWGMQRTPMGHAARQLLLFCPRAREPRPPLFGSSFGVRPHALPQTPVSLMRTHCTATHAEYDRSYVYFQCCACLAYNIIDTLPLPFLLSVVFLVVVVVVAVVMVCCLLRLLLVTISH